MKHKTKSASPCDLERQRFRDRLHRQAKQHSNSTHGRIVVCSDHHIGAPFLTSQAELRPRFPQTSAHIGVSPSSGTATFDDLKTYVLLQPVDFTLLLSPADTVPARKLARKNFQKPQQNTQNGTKNTLFFSEDPNVASRSACSAYPYEKINNRVAVVKDSPFRSKPLVVRFAEILLRFAETSQQTLRHFLLLPTTYINFAEKNALKSKLLRHLTHTTIVDSNFMARGFRAKVAAAACRWSPVEPLQSHSILSLARRVRFHFLAFGLQPSALSFDLHQPLDYRALSEIIGFEFPVAFVLPDGPETLAWRFMTGELLVEQAILDPLATREDIQRFCDEATRRGYHAISVPSSRVAETYEFLQDSDLNVSCLVGFPFGNADADVKRFETEVAVDNGAHEINLMISLGYIKERAFQRVLRELRDVVEAADERVVKVFIEPRFLTPPELEDTVNLVLDSGAQFIATTVWSSGSVLDEVRRLRELVGDKFGVLAATAQDNLDPKELLSLGATRLLIAKIGQTIRSSEQAFGI